MGIKIFGIPDVIQFNFAKKTALSSLLKSTNHPEQRTLSQNGKNNKTRFIVVRFLVQKARVGICQVSIHIIISNSHQKAFLTQVIMLKTIIILRDYFLTK